MITIGKTLDTVVWGASGHVGLPEDVPSRTVINQHELVCWLTNLHGVVVTLRHDGSIERH